MSEKEIAISDNRHQCTIVSSSPHPSAEFNFVAQFVDRIHSIRLPVLDENLGLQPRPSWKAKLSESRSNHSHALYFVATVCPEFRALDCYAMGADVKECKNLRRCLVAATFEKTKTYAFAVVSDYESHALTIWATPPTATTIYHKANPIQIQAFANRGTGVPPVNHANPAPATFRVVSCEFVDRVCWRAGRGSTNSHEM